MANGKGDQTEIYDFGPGTYGKPGLFDSQADQDAIARGHASSPRAAEMAKQDAEQLRKIVNGLIKTGPYH
jgi:hypothetical protein